jgi:AcrR family transcriptional regulator
MTNRSKITRARREREKRERRKSILNAALQLFVERGFRNTKMEMVAEKAEISKGLLYFYFHSKEELLSEIIRENFQELLEFLSNLKRDKSSPEEKLLKFIEGELTFYSKKRDLSKFLFSLLSSYELKDLKEKYREVFLEMHNKEKAVLREILAEGIEKGVFEKSDLEELMYFISGPLHGLILFKESPIKNPNGVARSYYELFLHGLSKRGGSR